jgi:hypothetical protein
VKKSFDANSRSRASRSISVSCISSPDVPSSWLSRAASRSGRAAGSHQVSQFSLACCPSVFNSRQPAPPQCTPASRWRSELSRWASCRGGASRHRPETSSCIQYFVIEPPSHPAGGVQRTGNHEATLFSSACCDILSASVSRAPVSREMQPPPSEMQLPPSVFACGSPYLERCTSPALAIPTHLLRHPLLVTRFLSRRSFDVIFTRRHALDSAMRC